MIVLVAATAVLGGLYWRQNQVVRESRDARQKSEQRNDELQADLRKREQQADRLREQVEIARENAGALAREAAQLRQTAGALAPVAESDARAQTNTRPWGAIGEMFKDPAMRDAIQLQQRAALGSMNEKLYGRLYADLHLTPEQAIRLKELILNKQLAGAEMGMSMFVNGVDGEQGGNALKQMKEANEASDAQIKELLGEEAFPQYQAYEKTLAERMMISGLKDQLGSGSSALNGDQEEQLVQAMAREREAFKFTTDFSDQTKVSNFPSPSLLTEENLDRFGLELEQLGRQYLIRAEPILTPEQLAAFKNHLASQQAMQKAGLRMAAKMFRQ